MHRIATMTMSLPRRMTCSRARVTTLRASVHAALLTAALHAAAVPPAVPSAQDLSQSAEVLETAAWVRRAHDNGPAPFMVVDKKLAVLHVFDAHGMHIAASPILLGMTIGDRDAPGIGGKRLAEISNDERTTPAGRFFARPGRNQAGEDVLWIQYADGVSMHRLRASNPREHRP